MSTGRGIETLIDTRYGDARLVTFTAQEPVATLLLSHGAGNGIDTHDLEALAEHLPSHGISVILLEQPWRVAGRAVASPPPTLDVALIAAAGTLSRRSHWWSGAAPRSSFGRRCASLVSAAGCLAIAFPLHPPGKPEKSRLPELVGAGVPTLVIQGDRDALGRPEEFPADLEADLCVVPGGDHSLRVPARGAVSMAEAMEIVVEATLEWITREITGAGSGGGDIAGNGAPA